MNSNFQSLRLLVQRELLLWWRDKYAIKAKFGQSLFMGVLLGKMNELVIQLPVFGSLTLVLARFRSQEPYFGSRTARTVLFLFCFNLCSSRLSAPWFSSVSP
jgi:hypothetical protein